jgi:ATP synthase protein I
MQDIAASYLVGALGGIVYLRLLGRGVDSVAASSIGEAAGGALGQQRLLIPVILVLFYNRYASCLLCPLGTCQMTFMIYFRVQSP